MADFQVIQPETTYTGSRIGALPKGLPKTTQSLCPECTQLIAARIFEEGGKVVMENRKITTFNEAEILFKAQERYEQLTKNLRPAILQAERQIPYIEKVYRREIRRQLPFHRSAAWE